MKRINTNKWKEFDVMSFFTLNKVKNKVKIYNVRNNGITPVYSSESSNKNIGYIDDYPEFYVDEEQPMYLIFGDHTKSMKIIETSFSVTDNVKVLSPKIKSKYCLFFVITLWLANIPDLGYSRHWSVAKKSKKKLPVDKNGNPDWEYIEKFIKKLESHKRFEISNIINYLDNTKFNKIDTSKWKRFNLYDDNLFEIFSGNKLDKKNMTSIDPSINFIGRSSLDNGVAEKVDKIENIEPYKPGDMTLALGGYLGSCFIQKEPFYTSQNVNVLRARKDISFNCKLFISTMIFKESQLYYKAFENELNRHVNKGFSILLPVDKNANPDWEYMENFIKEKYQYTYEMLDSIL